MNNRGQSLELRQISLAQRRFSLAAGARQIIIVRHGSSTGKTAETIEVGTLTISNPPLTEDGRAQALAVSRALAQIEIAGIFISPLQRTAQTAAPLAQQRGIAPIVIDDLRELYLGDFEHTFYDHAAAGHPAIARMFADENWDAIPNSEQADEFTARVHRGIARLLQMLEPDETAILFSHGGVISEVCRQATGSRRFAFLGVENASISRYVVLSDGTLTLRSFNEISHL